MVANNNLRHANHPPRPVDATHVFKIGEMVHIKGAPGSLGPVYRITGALPLSGASPQYRIRNDDERYERVTIEDNLERTRPSPGRGADSLMERTFSHGQGTAAQPARDKKAKTAKAAAQV